jgi:uncharacterized protein YciI
MISKYLAPPDEVDRVRPEHKRYMASLAELGVLVSSGQQDPPVGGVILFDVDTEAEARELLAADPFVQQGLAVYEPTGWKPTRGLLADWQRKY